MGALLLSSGDDLDQLIRSHCTGELDSSGRFSLDAERALEKIARHQLPYPDAWVLKLAQAAVLSDSAHLTIKQTGSETRLRFLPRQPWDFDFGAAYYDPTDHPDAAFQSLRAGLWALGLRLRRPFKYSGPQGGYFWDGFQLQPVPQTRPESSVTISVSHRTAEQGKGIPLLRQIQAAQTNSELAQIISGSLFSCPLEVSLDGRRIDGFYRCPGHGFSRSEHPLCLIWLEGEPALGIPPCHQFSEDLYCGDAKLRKLSDQFVGFAPDRPVRGAALLSGHARYVSSGKNGSWCTFDRESVLYWIRHGVVIQKELFTFKKTTVSLALFVNADDIRTDFSGFGLDETAAQQRRTSVYRQLESQWLQKPIDLTLVDRQAHNTRLKLAAGMAVAGGALHFVCPPATILTVMGVVGGLYLSQGLASVDKALHKGYQKLRDQWQPLVRPAELD